MRKLLSGAACFGLSAIIGMTSVLPAHAERMIIEKLPNYAEVEQLQMAQNDVRVEQVQYGGRHQWRGHRGYRERRAGYRRHNDGWWYPLAAFGTGVVIGGALSNRPARVSGDHVQWCYDRYRSYRASDNSYQPNYGGRRECVSPY